MKRTQPNGRKSELPDGLHFRRTESEDPKQAWEWFVIQSGRQTVGCREVGYASKWYAKKQAHKTLSGGYSYLLDGDQ